MSSEMDPNKTVKNQVILLMGKTGAGKSTLGNLLLLGKRNGPFTVSSEMKSETKECQVETLSFHGNKYDIVDTPGMYDTDGINSLKKIADFVHTCPQGVKAILLVLKTERFTDEQRNTLHDIRNFLGEDAGNNIIVVFAHANPEQIESRDIMQEAWTNLPFFRSFICDIIKSRWIVSPNPYYLNVDSERQLMEIKYLIGNIRDIYTTRQFIKNQEKLAEERRKKEEKDRREREEYENNLKENAVSVYKTEQENIQENLQKKLKQLEDDLEDEKRNRNRYRRNSDSGSVERAPHSIGPCYVPVKTEPERIIVRDVVYIDRPKEITNEKSKEVTNGGSGIIDKVVTGAIAGTFVVPGMGTFAGAMAGLVKGVMDEVMK